MKIINKVDIKPTVDGSWHLVTVPADISGYNCAIVLFTGISGTQDYPNMFTTDVRPTGVTLTHPNGKAVGGNYCVRYIAIDASDQFEITCNNAGTGCYIVGGFTDAEAVMETGDWTANDVTPTAVDQTPENIDISSYLGGDTAVAAVLYVKTGNGQRMGYAYDLVSATYKMYVANNANHVLVPVTSNQVRLSRNNLGVSYSFAGYIKSGITLNTTRSNFINTASVWTAAAVPDVTTEDVAFFRTGRDGTGIALAREVGENMPEWGSTAYCGGQIPLRLDVSGEVEVYSDSNANPIPEWFATNDTGTALTIDSTDASMQRNTNFQVVCSTPTTTPTTGNTTLTNGNDTLTPTSVTGSDPYTLTFPVGDLSKQVDGTGYDWTLEITP